MTLSEDSIFAEKEQKRRLVWQAREWTIFCAKTIEAQAPDFWSDLSSTIRELLEKFGLPDTALQQTLPSEFIIHQPRYPAVDVIASLDIPAHTIRITTIRRAKQSVSPTKREERLRFCLDDAGKLYIKHGEELLNVDDVAKLLLHPFVG
jgi:hypothetical protein